MNWEVIRREYKSSDITLKDLADKHNIKLGTLKSRKSREGWTRGRPKKDATKSKKVATIKKKDATPKQVEKEPVIISNELTDKQKLFCLYYLKYFNATKAYQKAYDCTYLTARVEGSRNLAKPNIKKEIDRIKNERLNNIALDGQSVLQKYIDIAFADITDFAVFGKKEVQEIGMFGPMKDEDGNPIMREVNYVDFKESSEVDGTIITEVKQGKDGISVKLADKMKALDFLMKYTDLLNENELKQLKVERERIAIRKENGDDGDEYEDDGFIDALNGAEVNWDE